VLGYTDGKGWSEIARASFPIEVGRTYRLEVRARGEEIAASIDGREVVRARDGRATAGTVGLRVVDVHAAFDDVAVEAVAAP
jgi:hypothetical protein